jgi:acetylornithine deacetylase/succinyl-diaminopimelate desuccinylase-like protein
MLLSSGTFAQHKWNREELNEVANKYCVSSLDMFMEMLAIRNDANSPEMLTKNIEWFESAFKLRNFSVKRLASPSLPALLIEKETSPAAKTVLFYMHGDGQPVNVKDWNQEDPWKPVIKQLNNSGVWEEIAVDHVKKNFDPDFRLYARSASDDKGPVAMFLAAIDALDDAGADPEFNIKVYLDFEEESGSPNLERIVNTNKELLASDLIVIFDGPNHSSNKPTLCFGARGITRVALTAYGAKVALHSGHYGNYSPNPAFIMAGLLSSMKDETGRVIIPGFYDGIELSDEEKAILERVPDDEAELNRKLGIASPDRVGNSYQESLQYPSLNIRGLQAGNTGENVTNIVPDKCIAEIDIRTVPESDPERLIQLVKEHIKGKGFYLTEKDPTDEERMKYGRIIKIEKPDWYQAFRTSMESVPGIWLNSAMERAFGEEPVRLRILGGSLPIAPFINALGAPAVIVPTVNPDNNQHGPDENLRLGNYRDGIKTMLAIFTEKL